MKLVKNLSSINFENKTHIDTNFYGVFITADNIHCQRF